MATRAKVAIAISIVAFVAIACVASFFILKSMHHEAGLEMEKLYGISRHNAEVYANCREYEEQIADALSIASIPEEDSNEKASQMLLEIKGQISPQSLTLSNGTIWRYDELVAVCDDGVRSLLVNTPVDKYLHYLQGFKDIIEDPISSPDEIEMAISSLKLTRDEIEQEGKEEFDELIAQYDETINEAYSALEKSIEAQENELTTNEPMSGYSGTIAEDMLREEEQEEANS